MKIQVDLVSGAIEKIWAAPPLGSNSGAVVEFKGVVRAEEDGRKITALRYEAYETMARAQMERILGEQMAAHPFHQAMVLHRVGWIPVGDAAILVWIESKHRGAAFAVLSAFMDRLKQDVPVWKVETAGS